MARHPRAVVLVLSSILAACTPPVPTTGEATVVEVIDGDTITVTIGPHTEHVRLLGVDTPETVHPTKPVECFGPEASAFTADLLPPGTGVRLERDREVRDHFGRLLAYVHRADDGLFVNLELVERGFADVLVIAPNDAYAPVLRVAAAAAREAPVGRWAACGGTSAGSTGASGGPAEAVPSPP